MVSAYPPPLINIYAVQSTYLCNINMYCRNMLQFVTFATKVWGLQDKTDGIYIHCGPSSVSFRTKV